MCLIGILICRCSLFSTRELWALLEGWYLRSNLWRNPSICNNMICVPISKVLPNGPKIWSEKKLVVVASMDFWNIQKNKSGLIVVDLLCNHFTSGSKKSVTKSNYWPIYIMVHNGENQPMDRFYYRHFWTGHYKNVQIETLKNENSYFLNSNTCSCSRLLGISSVLGPN